MKLRATASMTLALILGACARSVPSQAPDLASPAQAKAPPAEAKAPPEPEFHLQPAMRGLQLLELDRAPRTSRSVSEVVELQLHDERNEASTPGEPHLRFYGFNDESLVFLRGSYVAEAVAQQAVKQQGVWLVEEWIDVARTEAAVERLGLANELAKFESGICGIAVGMNAAQVEQTLGEPQRVVYPTAWGCEQHDYGGLYVSICFGEVRDITPPSEGKCP